MMTTQATFHYRLQGTQTDCHGSKVCTSSILSKVWILWFAESISLLICYDRIKATTKGVKLYNLESFSSTCIQIQRHDIGDYGRTIGLQHVNADFIAQWCNAIFSVRTAIPRDVISSGMWLIPSPNDMDDQPIRLSNLFCHELRHSFLCRFTVRFLTAFPALPKQGLQP